MKSKLVTSTLILGLMTCEAWSSRERERALVERTGGSEVSLHSELANIEQELRDKLGITDADETDTVATGLFRSIKRIRSLLPRVGQAGSSDTTRWFTDMVGLTGEQPTLSQERQYIVIAQTPLPMPDTENMDVLVEWAVVQEEQTIRASLPITNPGLKAAIAADVNDETAVVMAILLRVFDKGRGVEMDGVIDRGGLDEEELQEFEARPPARQTLQHAVPEEKKSAMNLLQTMQTLSMINAGISPTEDVVANTGGITITSGDIANAINRAVDLLYVPTESS
ncbi:MAG: hypothetical protein LBJ69_01070 [Holosporales bacterium]|jgi:hypothetical protein|nr:hypothetical protein [Holosporales bacterium]